MIFLHLNHVLHIIVLYTKIISKRETTKPFQKLTSKSFNIFSFSCAVKIGTPSFNKAGSVRSLLYICLLPDICHDLNIAVNASLRQAKSARERVSPRTEAGKPQSARACPICSFENGSPGALFSPLASVFLL